MTVNNLNITSGPYVGNGVSSIFSITFEALTAAEVAVYEINISGTLRLLNPASEYTLVGTVGAQSIQLASPLQNGFTLVLSLDKLATQDTSFASQGAFLSRIHEEAFDKLTVLIQQIQDQMKRTVRTSRGDLNGLMSELPSAPARAGKFLAFDDAGAIYAADGGPATPPGVVNQPPTISGIPAASVPQGTAYSFTPTASDPDGDTLTFAILNRPSWASFNTSTGALTGTPGIGNVGAHNGVVISVNDGALSAFLAPFNITVTAVNSPPVISGTPAGVVVASTAYSFTPTASDPDGDTLTFSITNRPSWAAFNTSTGALTGTPTPANEGTTGGIVIAVSDGTATVALPTFSVEVTVVNAPPVISGTPPDFAIVDSAYSFTPTASDPDGDPLTFAILNKPSWATFNTSTGALTGTPLIGDVGTDSSIVISVTDGAATASLISFSIAVSSDAGLAIITRKTHTKDTYVAQGATFSVTYVSDRVVYWQEKEGFTDMVKTISANGLECTLSHVIPAGRQGDSGYIGVEAWVYDDTVLAKTTIWDRWHIGKTAGDIVFAGIGTATTVLQSAIELNTFGSGDTLIINNGLYNHLNDTMMVGYWPGGTNWVTPNGVQSGVNTVDVLSVNGQTVVGTENIVNISKFTTIMAAEPMGCVVDRLYRNYTSRLLGEFRAGPNNNFGLRHTFGIKIKGFAWRNWVDGLQIQRADECAYECFSLVQDTLREDYVAGTPFFLDGAATNQLSTRNCYFESFSALTNGRFGDLLGRYSPWSLDATKFSSTRKAVITSGCSQGYQEIQVQQFCSYGARHTETLNCLAIDGVLFRGGHRNNVTANAPMNHDYAFIGTNGGSDGMYHEGVGVLNSVNAGYRCDVNDTPLMSNLKRSFFWKRQLGSSTFIGWIRGKFTNTNNVTIGRNETSATGPSAVSEDRLDHDMKDMLFMFPRWTSVYSDAVISGYSLAGTDDNNFAFTPTAQVPAAGYLANIVDYEVYAATTAKTNGGMYITKIKEGSTFETLGVGVNNWFASIGEQGELYLDSTRKLYDGNGGRKYVNWLSRAPTMEWKTERATYSSTVNAVAYLGNVGAFADNTHIIDYINAEGTEPTSPVNVPYVEDLHVHLNASNHSVITWRPISPTFQAGLDSYDIYVDGAFVANVAKTVITYTRTGLTAGSHKFNIVCKSASLGDSDLGRSVYLVTP